jgi:hypothetical protein
MTKFVAGMETLLTLLSALNETTRYTGIAFGCEYRVTAKHSPWRTAVEQLSIDCVEYSLYGRTPVEDEQTPDVQIRSVGWMTKRLKIRRQGADGSMAMREEIHVTGAALGGAGEVEVRKALDVVPLLPEVGSRSETRDLRRVAHPERYAVVSEVTALIRLLVPLLGLGALFAWLFEPISRWMKAHVWPRFEPVSRWLKDILTPVGQFFERLFAELFGWTQICLIG